MIHKLLCKLLQSANTKQVDMILKAAVKRREELFPDWEITYIALPKKDKKMRGEMLQQMLKLEEGEPEKDSCF